MFLVSAYVPPRTAITSPAAALSTAFWMVASGAASVPAAESLPFGATTIVVAATAGALAGMGGAAATASEATAIGATGRAVRRVRGRRDMTSPQEVKPAAAST